MDFKTIQEEFYNEYICDVDIATTAIKNALLYPTGKILFDLYAIPSHNHQAYYALVVEKENSYELVYAKTEIRYPVLDETVRMYTFSDAKEAEASNNKVGKIIIGISSLNSGFVDKLKDIQHSVPSGKYFLKDGFALDGVFQVIRFFDKAAPCKEIVYEDGGIPNIPIPPGKEELLSFMDDLYLIVEETIQ